MGEVYRARDTRLDRVVAIKVLAGHLSSDPDLKQRFGREAQAISSLSHPNICHLYDVGTQDGTDFLVMEYVEGDTLAERLRRGPLPLDQVLRIGIEVADALAEAHQQSIVHRDLKPGNIMLTKSGAKLMDFGLAKMQRREPAGSVLAQMAADTKSLTAEGTIVGSLQYMAPEQLEGNEADSRSDIFAFGTVLYEMITGRPPFDGKSKASVVAAIISSEPRPISTCQPLTPTTLDWLIRTCLRKDRGERWRDAYDLKLQLAWIRDECSKPQPERQYSAQQTLPGSGAHSVRAYVLPPEESHFVFTGPNSGPVVISPDGRRLAFIARQSERTVIFVRPVDSVAAQPLAGTEGASFPFWSHDSRSLGFFSAGKLKTIEASGGSPQTLCDAPTGRGGSWNQYGTIIFTPTPTDPIYRVSAAGGVPQAVTILDPTRITTHRWPCFLPDGRHFLYLGGQPLTSGGIYVGCLDGNEQKLILHSYWNAAYATQGFLLFIRDSVLFARRFDAQKFETYGEDFPLGEHVMADAWVQRAIFSASETGALVFQRADIAAGPRLVWFHRSGKQGKMLPDSASYALHRLSPDGLKLAAADRLGGVSNIWILDLMRNTKIRLTFDPSTNLLPVWSPDGKRVVFASNRKGLFHIYQKASDGAGSEELLFESGAEEQAESWSVDGKYLAYMKRDPERRGVANIWILPVSSRRKHFSFIESEFEKCYPQFSPDGKWMAYASNESGSFEIYVAPFPTAKGRWQISTSGGTFPRWRGDGKELFYLGPDNRLRATDVNSHGSRLNIGSTRVLFQVQAVSPPATPFDVTPDGKRFLFNTMPATQSDFEPITLVINWPAQLK
jgi:eukaryotic-like serine/threonine-protein kinase